MRINKTKTFDYRVRLAANTMLDGVAHPFLMPCVAVVALCRGLFWMPLNSYVILLIIMGVVASLYCMPMMAALGHCLIVGEKRPLRPRKRGHRLVMATVSFLFLASNWIGFQFIFSVPPIAQLLLIAMALTGLYIMGSSHVTIDGYALGLGATTAYLTALSLAGMVLWPWPVMLLVLTGLEAWLSVDTHATTAKRFIVSFVTGALVTVPFIFFDL